MTLQIAPRSPAGAHPARFAENISVQGAFNQERQRGVDHVRRILGCATLRHQRLVRLRQLRLRRNAGVLRVLRGRYVLNVFVLEHIGLRRIAINHRNIALRAGNFWPLFKNDAALIVLDFADEIRADQETAVSHHRIAASNLKRGERRGAQRQRFCPHDVLRREAEALKILCRVVHTHGAHRANHDNVL